MDQTCDEIDEMFSNLLGEMDLLTQSLGIDTLPSPPATHNSIDNFSFGFKDLNESLNALEDNDLDALMADLVADCQDAEIKVNHHNSISVASSAYADTFPDFTHNLPTGSLDDLSFLPPPPPSERESDLPPPPPDPHEPIAEDAAESKAKVDKIKLALGKMKEAKVKKLIVKVHMTDNSTKTLMVDESLTVRDVLDNLFEKTHCDCNVEWCLYEESPVLQIERFFEDHENIVELLSDWTRDSENKILFLEKKEKYAVFKNPQNFYMARKGSSDIKDMNEKAKVLLLEQSFCGPSVVVPELEGAIYLKEDGKKSWKKRYFLLRASGIYYVPKGKTKTSRDLACFTQFDNVNVYYGVQYKVKYKAPTDHCFVLKHPQIQKESQYIKYLCCDEPWVLHQWVTGIRIAKYGKTLYDNYKMAVQKAGLASRWMSLGNSSTQSTTGTSQGNGQIPVKVTSVGSTFSDAWKRGEGNTDLHQPSEVRKTEEISVPPISTKKPPPPPTRGTATMHSVATPPLPLKAKPILSNIPPPPPACPPPDVSPGEDDFLPPPPPDFFDAPPEFLPPPPSYFNDYPPPPLPAVENAGAPTPPPPPPPLNSAPSVAPQVPVKKKPPNPPIRRDSTGSRSREQHGTTANGGAGGQPDFMSDLMSALQKKRGTTS
ncbi:amyloid beta A4 precursor protein-binding family B member 1-interacting protein [Gastrophryne carolinensis]